MKYAGWVTVGLAIILAALTSGCDSSGSSGCGPEHTEQDLELWSVSTDGTDRRLEREVWEYTTPLYYELFAADGSEVYFSPSYYDDGLYVLDRDGGAVTRVFEQEDVSDFHLSPSGAEVAYTSDQTRRLWVAGTAEGNPTLVRADSVWIRRPMWVGDDRSIAYARVFPVYAESESGGVWLTDLDDGATRRLSNWTTSEFDVRSDASAVIYSAGTSLSDASDLHVFYKASDEEAIDLGKGGGPRFAGNHIVFLSDVVANHPTTIYIAEGDGSGRRVLAETDPIEGRLYVDPSGEAVLVQTAARLLRVDLTSGEVETLVVAADHLSDPVDSRWEEASARLNQMTVSKDGTRIYYYVTSLFFDDGC